jgi:hypothetical protein
MQAAFHCYSLNNVLLILRHQRLQAHSTTRVLACAIASKRWSLHWRRSSSPSQNHGNRLPRWVYATSCSESPSVHESRSARRQFRAFTVCG